MIETGVIVTRLQTPPIKAVRKYATGTDRKPGHWRLDAQSAFPERAVDHEAGRTGVTNPASLLPRLGYPRRVLPRFGL
jgi:hypothetical protein